MFFKKAKHIRRIAHILLLGYVFFGAGIAEGMVLCLYNDGKISIESKDVEIYLPFSSCASSDNDDSASSNAIEFSNLEKWIISDGQYECGEACRDIPLSISNSVKQFIENSGERIKLIENRSKAFTELAYQQISRVATTQIYHKKALKADTCKMVSIRTVILIS